MVTDARRLSPMRSRILGILLEAVNPAYCGGDEVLWPLWANETMHRAHQMIRLTRMLDRGTSCAEYTTAESDLELGIAKDLAATLISLRIAYDTEMVPCSEGLREVARNLVELFGEVAGIGGISTSAERLRLPSFKRRALTLLAGQLVVEALLCAFRKRRNGQIIVALDRSSRGFGRRAVGYSDCLVTFGPRSDSRGVIDDLASLLETDVVYRADRRRMVAEVEFPLW